MIDRAINRMALSLLIEDSENSIRFEWPRRDMSLLYDVRLRRLALRMEIRRLRILRQQQEMVA